MKSSNVSFPVIQVFHLSILFQFSESHNGTNGETRRITDEKLPPIHQTPIRKGRKISKNNPFSSAVGTITMSVFDFPSPEMSK